MKDRKKNKFKELLSSSKDKIISSKYGSIISMVDELTSLGCFDSGFTMPIPRLAFIGDPTSGKTSLIDTLLGYDFLPRETPTRRIVEIRITRNIEVKPYVEFLTDVSDKKKISNLKEAKEILKNLQVNASGALLNEPIKISLTTPSSADIVLFDTPPIEDANSSSKTNVVNVIKDSSVLIVLVMSALELQEENVMNRDKWFQLLNQYDTDKNRSICAFTKIDLLPGRFNWANLKKYFKDTSDPKISDIIPIKYGYIGLKLNYSPNFSSNELSHFEKDFFSSHKILQFYSTNEYFTLDTFCDKLSKYMFDQPVFRRKLGEIYEKLNDRIEFNQKELKNFGSDQIDFSSSSKEVYLQSLLNMFCENVDKLFSGKSENKDDNIANSNIKKQYIDFLITYTGYQPSKTAKNTEIIKTIQQQEGVHLSGFPGGDVIYKLLEDEITTLRNEVKIYLDNIYLIIITVIKDLVLRLFGRFPKALNQFEELVQGFLEKEFEKSKDIVNSIAEMNFNYLYIDEQSRQYQEMMQNNMLQGFDLNNPNNANNPNANNPNANTNKNLQEKKSNSNSNSNLFKPQSEISFFKSAKDKDVYYKGLADYVKVLVDYIYSQIIRNLREYIPKTTGNFYVKSIKTNMRYYLLSKVTQDPEFIENLQEDPEQAAKRVYYSESLKRLKKILKEINYDDNLMKIIKGDDSKKQIDNIVQQQLKVESSTDQTASKSSSIFGFSKKTETKETKSSTTKPMSTTSSTTSSTASVQKPTEEPEKKSIFGSLFGQGGSKPGNKPVEQPKPEPPKPHTPTTSNPLQQPQNPQGKPQNKGLDVNFKFDPTSNKVKDVNVSGQMDYDTAKTIYDNNKQYLPTGAQVMSGLKTGYNVGSKVLAENEAQNPQSKKGFF